MENTISNEFESSAPTVFSHESIETAVTKAVENALHAIEPRLQKAATEIAHKTVDKGQELAERTYRRIERQPLAWVGIAAFALAGYAIAMFAHNKTVTRQLH